MFMPPTALKMCRQVQNPRARWKLAVRSIGSGGESLGEELLQFCRDTFGITPNECALCVVRCLISACSFAHGFICVCCCRG